RSTPTTTGTVGRTRSCRINGDPLPPHFWIPASATDPDQGRKPASAPGRKGKKCMADRPIDARNLTCPLPVLKLRKALRDMAAGQTVELLATDPGALDDVPHFCAASGC